MTGWGSSDCPRIFPVRKVQNSLYASHVLQGPPISPGAPYLIFRQWDPKALGWCLEMVQHNAWGVGRLLTPEHFGESLGVDLGMLQWGWSADRRE